jgi:hypothetical protein
VTVTGSTVIAPEEILRRLLTLDPGLRLERYYGERAIFYNPGGVASLGGVDPVPVLTGSDCSLWGGCESA